MGFIRAFIAVPLPAALQKKIWQETASLREDLPEGSVRWVPPQNFHLTLKFLGDTAEKDLKRLEKIIADEALKIPAFALGLQRTGAFPNLKKPRVIWLGVAGKEKMLPLHKAVEGAASQIGSEAERRPFSPHLTLGRVNDRKINPQHLALISQKMIEKADVDFGEFHVKSIHLMESQLKSTGAVYRTRFEAKLGDFFE